MRALAKIASAAALAVATISSANAAVFVFNFSGTDNSNTLGSAGNVVSSTATNGSSTLGLDVTGWSSNGSSLISAYLGSYAAGLGVKTKATDAHSIDNMTTTDFVMLKFSRNVNLSSAVFNAFYVPGANGPIDSDAIITSAQSYTSNPTPLQTTPAGVFSSDVSSNSSLARPLATSGMNNVWFIAAGGADKLIDGFKIGQITVSAAVPEPTTWAFMILGFGAIGMAMRSRRAKAAKVSYAF